MRRGLKPRREDVTRRHLPPCPRKEILAEGRVPIAGRANGCSHICTARRMRELTTRRDSLTFERGSAAQCRSLREPTAAILSPGPVDETADRSGLDSGSSGRVVRRLACPSGREVRAPCATSSVGTTHDEEGRHGDQNGRRHDEADRSCRRRRGHGSHRAPNSIWILALIGGRGIPRVSDPGWSIGSCRRSRRWLSHQPRDEELPIDHPAVRDRSATPSTRPA